MRRLIKEVIKKYSKKIAIKGSNTVLGLEEHLDKIVADLMGVELEIIKIAKQWHAVIERAAITDKFDEKGYEKARIKLENSKEDFEKLRLILEETYQTPVNKKTQKKASRNTKKESMTERESRAKRELEEISKQRKEKTLQYNTPKQTTTTESKLVYKQQNQSSVLEISKDYITIWDLST
ncbi:2133_t:CDS:2 [Cetraspora pellucida]|uniref:2133_t:CDS:1 n=1 Tax=Cetraspora pellucida TaxID=1433469 RepID=A0ACA9PQ08_9GLOM|nr:2133_t:CDS:2 [Cetraspora pellucida]